MNATKGTEMGTCMPLHLPARRLSMGTMYAWNRIVETYVRRHPKHEVRVLYRCQVVQHLNLLLRHSPDVDPAEFGVRVQTPDGNTREVARLLDLMQEAAKARHEHFLIDDQPERWFSGMPE